MSNESKKRPAAFAPEIKKEEKSPVISKPKIVSVKTEFLDLEKQDKIIIDKENQGYLHYESLPIIGNEIVLRFRLVK